jgi:hypothetical protein
MSWKFWKKRKQGQLIDLTTLQLKPDCKYVLFYNRAMVRRVDLDEALGAILGTYDVDRVRVVGVNGNPKSAIRQLELQ